MLGTQLEVATNRLPLDGSQVYVTLRSHFTGIGLKVTEVGPFTTHNDPDFAAELVAPASGSIFDSNEVTFTWTDAESSNYFLQVGSAPRTNDYAFKSLFNGETEYTFNQLPIDGSTLYVTLRTIKYGVYQYRDYEFTAHNAVD